MREQGNCETLAAVPVCPGLEAGAELTLAQIHGKAHSPTPEQPFY